MLAAARKVVSMTSSSQLRGFVRNVYGYDSKGQALEADLFQSRAAIEVLYTTVSFRGLTAVVSILRLVRLKHGLVVSATVKNTNG